MDVALFYTEMTRALCRGRVSLTPRTGKVSSPTRENDNFFCRQLIIHSSLPEWPVVIVHIYTHIHKCSWLQIKPRFSAKCVVCICSNRKYRTIIQHV